jgi:hypothetical protein
MRKIHAILIPFILVGCYNREKIASQIIPEEPSEVVAEKVADVYHHEIILPEKVITFNLDNESYFEKKNEHTSDEIESLFQDMLVYGFNSLNPEIYFASKDSIIILDPFQTPNYEVRCLAFDVSKLALDSLKDTIDVLTSTQLDYRTNQLISDLWNITWEINNGKLAISENDDQLYELFCENKFGEEAGVKVFQSNDKLVFADKLTDNFALFDLDNKSLNYYKSSKIMLGELFLNDSLHWFYQFNALNYEIQNKRGDFKKQVSISIPQNKQSVYWSAYLNATEKKLYLSFFSFTTFFLDVYVVDLSKISSPETSFK